jgi:hypothetical protein
MTTETAEKAKKVERKTVLLFLLVEFIILHFLYSTLYDFSDVRNVVAEVEFGATLLSIVLAVIAILYTFWQGVSQSDFNVSLMSQMGRLERIGSDLSTNNERLHESVKHSEKISTDLLRIESSVSGVKDELSNLGSAFQSMLSAEKPTKSSAGNGDAAVARFGGEAVDSVEKREQTLAEFEKIFSLDVAQKCLIFILNEHTLEHMTMLSVARKFAELVDGKPEKDAPKSHAMYMGVFATVLEALRRYRIVKINEIDVEKKFVKIKILNDWKTVVGKYLEKQRKDEKYAQFSSSLKKDEE